MGLNWLSDIFQLFKKKFNKLNGRKYKIQQTLLEFVQYD